MQAIIQVDFFFTVNNNNHHGAPFPVITSLQASGGSVKHREGRWSELMLRIITVVTCCGYFTFEVVLPLLIPL